jgi:hypothetical protein
MPVIKLKDLLLETKPGMSPFLTPDDKNHMATLSKKDRMKYYMAKRRDYWISKGKCILCGKKPPISGKRLCSRCFSLQLTYTMQRNFTLQNQGICTRCGKNKTEPKPLVKGSVPQSQINYTYCAACRSQIAKQMAQLAAKKKANQPPKPPTPYVPKYSIEQ